MAFKPYVNKGFNPEKSGLEVGVYGILDRI